MRIITTTLMVLISIISFAQEKSKDSTKTKQPTEKLEEVIISSSVIFGNKHTANNRTGSAFYVSPEELNKFHYTDINRALRTVPGVNIYEEDGFGLRPNISLRGTSPERSSKITIMEDGILSSPAPYSASAAYYFPMIGRMQAIEILKGSSQIQYGPYTTGGAINLVSTQIPNSFSGNLNTSYGTYNTSQVHANIGNSKQNFGYLVEYFNSTSDGFKDLPNGENTGFDINDFVGKFRINSTPKETFNHSLDFKFQYLDERSNETYVGLTDADFKTNPYNRYAGSAEDVMKTQHVQFAATYTLEFTKNLRLTTTGYYNKFKRNWYKLNDVTAEGKKASLSDILENTETYPRHLSIIRGETDIFNSSLAVKANNRRYLSKGVQSKLDYHFYTGNIFHDVEVGARIHYDEEDRYQWVDSYGIVDGTMQLFKAGTPGTDANRISQANAFSAYALYRIKIGNLTLAPGVRYENIDLERIDYGKNDVSRTGSDLSTRTNKVDVFIPGIGANYKINEMVSVFGGVHKGFSPPSNSVGQKEEESVNYELGSRFNIANRIRGEVVGFYNDYENLLGSDLNATGGTGTLDQFNAGAAEVKGIEVLLNYDILKTNTFKVPFTFAYTYTDTEFKNSFDSAVGIWGEVNAGDEIPYISKHQFNAQVSLEHPKFELNLNGRYNGKFRTLAGHGDIPENEKIDSNFTLDASGKYYVNKYLNLTGRIINALDNTYAASRVPAGLRPGHPFGAYAGFEIHF